MAYEFKDVNITGITEYKSRFTKYYYTNVTWPYDGLMNLGTEPPELTSFSRELVNCLITFNFDF